MSKPPSAARYRIDLDPALGRDVEEMARQLGVDPRELVQTLVRDFVEFSRSQDPVPPPAPAPLQARSAAVIDIDEARRRRAAAPRRRTSSDEASSSSV